jgi:histidinol phosphatase-like enzyme/adenylate kinase family enzyme
MIVTKNIENKDITRSVRFDDNVEYKNITEEDISSDTCEENNKESEEAICLNGNTKRQDHVDKNYNNIKGEEETIDPIVKNVKINISVFNSLDPKVRKLFNTHDMHWTETNSMLIYKSPNFVYSPNIIIADLDGVLIKKNNVKNLYKKTTNLKGELCESVQLYSNNIARLIRAANVSLVIVSNQCTSSKVLYDIIKLKLESFIELTNLPVIALFPLKNNCFAKPHTKTWPMINYFFQQRSIKIVNTAVIGANAGMIEEKLTDGIIVHDIVNADTDRSYAHNIGASFIRADHFYGISRDIPLRWTSDIVEPEVRRKLIRFLNKIEKPDLWEEIKKIKADLYLIMIFGAPTCGKTTIANKLLETIKKEEWGDTNRIEYYEKKVHMSRIEKCFKNSIHVMLDGEYPNNLVRAPYLELAKKYNAAVVLIEVNVGMEMSKLFNHVRVENSKRTDLTLVKKENYYKYRGDYITPTISNSEGNKQKYILYCPTIELDNKILDMRF